MTAAVKLGLTTRQVYVLSAFHSPLHEAVYERPPKDVMNVDPTKLRKLAKVLYKLKNAGRVWYETFKEKLEDCGFGRSGSDLGLFTKGSSRGKIFLWRKIILVAG